MIGRRLDTSMRVPRDVIVAVVTSRAMPRRRHVAVVVVGSVGGRRPGRFLAVLVRLDVLAEVVGAHESFRADAADESFFSGVRPDVPLQFVGSGEALAAEQPVAEERSLAGVPAQVRLEV